MTTDKHERDGVIRHEEELLVSAHTREVGRLRIDTEVETQPVEETVERQIEHFDDLERTPPAANDSGEIETLEDGSISIPILEEQLVITKRLVVRERIIIRKHTTTEHQVVTAELRHERISLEHQSGTPDDARDAADD